MGNQLVDASAPFLGVDPAPGQDHDVPVRGLFQVIWRRKFLIAIIATPLIAATGFVVDQLPPTYKSTAVLLIDSPRAQPIPQLSSGEGSQLDMVGVKTQVSIIQSPNLAERVVEKLDLTHAPEFVSELDGSPSLVKSVIASVQQYVMGTKPADVPLTAAERAKTVAAMLLNKVKASNDGKSYLVEITALTKNDALGAEIANAFARIYLDFNRKLKVDAIDEANVRFFDQLPPLAQKVRDAGRLVQVFRVANGLTPASGSSQVEGRGATLADQQLAQINLQLGEVISDRTEKEAHLRQFTNALHGQGKVDALPEIVGSSLIQSLRQRQALLKNQQAALGASTMQSNPAFAAGEVAGASITNIINDEIRKISASVESSVKAARDREAILQNRLNSLKDLVASQSEAEIKRRDLQNQADAAREVYTSYLHRFQQTASLGLMQQPDAELISLADVPLSPAGPRRLALMALGSAVALAFAVLCALLNDRARRGFLNPQEVEQATGLTVIGFIPRLRRGVESLSNKETRLLYREAMSHVRSILEFGNSQYRARVVLVTSAVPGEGKSHFAAALARNVASSGGRALLVECDIRRPRVTASLALAEGGNAVFSTEPEGLHQMGNLAIDRAVVPGLDVATLQAAKSHPEYLPSLKRAREELDEARRNYDLIVLDGPPVLACGEAELFCGAADGVIVVIRWGETAKGTLLSALRTLRVYGVRTIGAVLNNVDIKELTKSGSDQGELYRGYSSYSQ